VAEAALGSEETQHGESPLLGPALAGRRRLATGWKFWQASWQHIILRLKHKSNVARRHFQFCETWFWLGRKLFCWPSRRDKPGGSPIPFYFAIENVRSILVRLPWRSLTDTVNLPCGKAANGFARVSSQTPSALGLKFLARFSPAAMPSIGKSAVTVKL